MTQPNSSARDKSNGKSIGRLKLLVCLGSVYLLSGALVNMLLTVLWFIGASGESEPYGSLVSLGWTAWGPVLAVLNIGVVLEVAALISLGVPDREATLLSGLTLNSTAIILSLLILAAEVRNRAVRTTVAREQNG